MTIFDTCVTRTRKNMGYDLLGNTTGSILKDYINAFGFNYTLKQYNNVINTELGKTSISESDFKKILRTETTSEFIPSETYIKEAFDELSVYHTSLGEDQTRLNVYINKTGIDSTLFKNNLMRLCGVSDLNQLESSNFLTGVKQAIKELIDKWGTN